MQNKFTALYNQHQDRLEDFWGRRNAHTAAKKQYTLFGLPLNVSVETKTHEAAIFAAFDLALTAYSPAPAIVAPPLQVNLFVRPAAWNPGSPPPDLYAINSFAGDDNWLMIQVGAWGHAHIDLKTRRATIVLTPELACESDILARGVLHTVLTNLLFSSGFSMLHCTGLVRDGRVLLLMAPHNSGKSTTALRLAMNGYQLLSDSQIYVSSHHDGLMLMGFPVGRARLRKDMLPAFPQLHKFLYPEVVRGETKFAFDLRHFDASLVYESAITVERVDLCLLQRGDGSAETTIMPISAETVWNAVMHNSLFYDTQARWLQNLHIVQPLIDRATHWQLTIGTDSADIVKKVSALS